jgi:hypothetical protein
VYGCAGWVNWVTISSAQGSCNYGP